MATLGATSFLYFRDEDSDIDNLLAAFEAGDTVIVRNPDGDLVLEAEIISGSDVSASNAVVFTVNFLIGSDTSIVPDGSVEYSAETRNVNDASIGDRAFSNPPSDLSDAEKMAARTAIGAGTAGTTSPSVATGATREERLTFQDAGSTSSRLTANTRLVPNAISVVTGSGAAKLITATDTTNGAETFTVAAGSDYVEIIGQVNSGTNRGQFGINIKRQSDDALIGSDVFVISASGWTAFKIEMFLPLDENTECYLEFDHQTRDLAFRRLELDVYRIGATGAGRTGLFDFTNTPDASDYEDKAIEVITDRLHIKRTSSETIENAFGGLIGTQTIHAAIKRWRGVAGPLSAGYEISAIHSGRLHALGNWLANPGNSLVAVVESQDGDFIAMMRQDVYDINKGSTFAVGDKKDFAFTFTRGDGTMVTHTYESVPIEGAFTRNGVSVVVFNRIFANAHNLYNEISGVTFTLQVYDEGTTDAFLEHTAATEHWVEYIEQTDVEQAGAIAENARNVDTLQANVDDLRNNIHEIVSDTVYVAADIVTAWPDATDAAAPDEIRIADPIRSTATAPAANSGHSTDQTISLNHEVGVYKKSSGTANQITGVIARWNSTPNASRANYAYGIQARPATVGQWMGARGWQGEWVHNPLGSPITAFAALPATGLGAAHRMLIEEGLAAAWIDDTVDREVYYRMSYTDKNGTKQTSTIRQLGDNPGASAGTIARTEHGGSQYRYMDYYDDIGFLRDCWNAANGDTAADIAARTVTWEFFADSNGSTPLYVPEDGYTVAENPNRELQAELAFQNGGTVIDERAGTINVAGDGASVAVADGVATVTVVQRPVLSVTQAAYDAITTKDAGTFYIISDA